MYSCHIHSTAIHGIPIRAGSSINQLPKLLLTCYIIPLPQSIRMGCVYTACTPYNIPMIYGYALYNRYICTHYNITQESSINICFCYSTQGFVIFFFYVLRNKEVNINHVVAAIQLYYVMTWSVIIHMQLTYQLLSTGILCW